MLAGHRAVRVGDQILKEIASLLLERVRDPRIRGVTVTGIRLSNDLRQARVFFSVMGGKNNLESVQKGLAQAKGFIKREMGIRMELKYIPEIIFVHDVSLENGNRLERVFEKLHSMESKTGKDKT